jgi:hypothetical protein
MVCRARSGASRSCGGQWDLTNRWIRKKKKLTGDLQDLDVSARKNRSGGGA